MDYKPKTGKFTLESLTTGMYSNILTIFREYIQNSTDAIDEARAQGYYTTSKSDTINIVINSAKRTVKIEDNGIGLPQAIAIPTLLDVGNSRKKFDKNRGFRGIGRLAGLSSCKFLIFRTKAKNEPNETVITWDCKQLKNILQPGKHEEIDLSGAIEAVTQISQNKAEKKLHYFVVEMVEVDSEAQTLLNTENVSNYISQIAPVPFDAQKFPYYSDQKNGIAQHARSLNDALLEYKVYLNYSKISVTKNYKTRFLYQSKVNNQQYDDVLEIIFFSEKDKDGNLIFWGWYGISNFKGTIKDELVSGFRLRLKNIQIGDNKTLDDCFSQSRFNRYFIGEIHACYPGLIPNAQRDNLEHNEAYETLKEAISKTTKNELSKIQNLFSRRNTALKKLEANVAWLKDLQRKKRAPISPTEVKEIENKEQKAKTEIEKANKELHSSKKSLEKYPEITKNREFPAESSEEIINTAIKDSNKKKSECYDGYSLTPLLKGKKRAITTLIKQIICEAEKENDEKYLERVVLTLKRALSPEEKK